MSRELSSVNRLVTIVIVLVVFELTNCTIALAGENPGAAASPTSVTHTFVPIQFPGANFTAVTGINNGGDFVGYFQETECAEDCFHGLIGIGGVLKQLDVSDPSSPTHNTQAMGINDSRIVVGSYGNLITDLRAFSWNATTNTFTLFDFVDPVTHETARVTSAQAINRAGVIVGDYSIAAVGPDSSFLLDNNGFHTLPVALTASFIGISNAGVIVGTAETGYKLRNGKVTQVTVPGASNTFANGISPKGKFIVGRYALPDDTLCCDPHGFLLVNGKAVTITYPGAAYTNVIGVNDSGVLVGMAQFANNSSIIGFIAVPNNGK